MAISTAPGSLLPPLRGELECPPDQWQFGLDSREVMLARRVGRRSKPNDRAMRQIAGSLTGATGRAGTERA